jgi:hypothetical protein
MPKISRTIVGLAATVAVIAFGVLATAPQAQADPTCCSVPLIWCVTGAGCKDPGEYFCKVSDGSSSCIFNAKNDQKGKNCEEYEHNCSDQIQW